MTEIFITIKIVKEAIRNRMNLRKTDQFICCIYFVPSGDVKSEETEWKSELVFSLTVLFS